MDLLAEQALARPTLILIHQIVIILLLFAQVMISVFVWHQDMLEQ